MSLHYLYLHHEVADRYVEKAGWVRHWAKQAGMRQANIIWVIEKNGMCRFSDGKKETQIQLLTNCGAMFGRRNKNLSSYFVQHLKKNCSLDACTLPIHEQGICGPWPRTTTFLMHTDTLRLKVPLNCHLCLGILDTLTSFLHY